MQCKPTEDIILGCLLITRSKDRRMHSCIYPAFIQQINYQSTDASDVRVYKKMLKPSMLYVGFGFVLRNSSIGGAFAIWYIQNCILCLFCDRFFNDCCWISAGNCGKLFCVIKTHWSCDKKTDFFISIHPANYKSSTPCREVDVNVNIAPKSVMKNLIII